MNSLPKELYIGILSHLDSAEDVLSLLEAFPLELTDHDWANLVSIRYFSYFKKEIYTHRNIRDIYLEFLSFRSEALDDIEYVDDPLNYPHALKYLMIRGFINAGVDTIAQLDDIELLYLNDIRADLEGHLYATDQLKDNLYYYLDRGSINIMRYIFEHGLYNNDTMRDAIFRAYDFSFVSLEMSKLIFEYILFDNNEEINILLHMYSEARESYEYILNMLPKDIDKDTLSNLLLRYSTEYHDNSDYNFIPLWNKYNHLLDSSIINNIYVNFFEQIEHGTEYHDLIHVIALISQHPVIREKYVVS